MMYEQADLQALALSCIPIEIQQGSGKQQVWCQIILKLTLFGR